MDADTHARRSPAVRARHFGKRLPGAPLENDGIAGLPVLSFASASTSASTDFLGGLSTDPAFLPLHPSTADPVVVFTTSATPTPTPSSTTTTTTTTTSSSVVSTTSTTPTISHPTNTPTTSSIAPATSATATPLSSSGASNADAASGASNGVSGGAIAAIVSILVVALLGIILFFVRKMFIRKRQLKRGTWGAGAFAKHTEFAPAEGEKTYDNAAGFMPGAGSDSPSFGAYGAASLGQQQSRFSQQAPIAPPPMAYNNLPPPSVVHPPSLAPGMGGAAAVGMERTAAAPTPTDALIKCTFIPSLPDELSITTGETVRVVAEYDDGWAMCANARGEQGMVPIECLDQSKGAGDSGSGGQGDWRGSRRVSSLPLARY